jgi:hypothetical protein
MSDCKSVADPKLATTPILYLPVNVPEPPEIAALEKSRNVKVDRLRRRIQHIGNIKPGEIADAGTDYFTRSQPPFLSSIIRAVYDAEVAAGQHDGAAQWLHRAYKYALRDHALWTAPFHKAWTNAPYLKMQAWVKNSGKPKEQIAIPYRECTAQSATP